MENLEQTNDQVQALLQTFYSMCITYGPQLILALVTLVVGLWIINKFVATLNKNLTSKVDATLGQFSASILSVIFKGILLISVASMIGIETTSFIAVLGAAGLAVGLALQGSLANFAGGVVILLFKPFKVGDLIEAQGYVGSVAQIQIFNTILKTGDNRVIIIPNGALSSSSMVNINQEDKRRVDFVFGIGYGDNIDQAKSVLKSIIKDDDRVLKDVEPVIVLSELADSSVNFTVRAWVKTADYWGVFFDTQERVKKQFDANGISIPYPQQDVHMHQVS